MILRKTQNVGISTVKLILAEAASDDDNEDYEMDCQPAGQNNPYGAVQGQQINAIQGPFQV